MKGSIIKHGQGDASSKKRILIAGAAMAVLGMAYVGTTYYEDISIAVGLIEPNTRVTIDEDQNISKGAKKGVHFIEKEEMEKAKNSVTLYFSYTSKNSYDAYKSISSMISSEYSDTKLVMHHLNLNPEWAMAHKTKLTLDMMGVTNVTHDDLFKLFIKNKPERIDDLAYFMLERKIDIKTFEEVYMSIDIINKSADDFERGVSNGFTFIPDIYVNGNNQVVLGALNSFDDISLVIDEVNNPTPTPINTVSSISNQESTNSTTPKTDK